MSSGHTPPPPAAGTDSPLDLEASEQRFRALTEHARDVILIVGADRRCRYASPAVEQLGYTPEALIGAPPEEHGHPEDIPIIHRAFEVAAEHPGRTVKMDTVRFRDSDGEWRELEAQITCLLEHPGIRGFVFNGRDVTERVRSEHELAEYRSRLEELVQERTRELLETQRLLHQKEKLAAVGRMIAMVNHEIRNPMGTVRAAAFSLREAVQTGNEARGLRSLDLLDRNLDRCEEIIGKLLDFTRNRPAIMLRQDLDGWLDEILDEVRVPEEIALDRALGAGVEVDLDRAELRRAVENLVQNAAQALRESGEAPTNGDARITVATRVVGDRVELAVEDNGPGIPDEEQAHVFTPFFSTRASGMGLGLSIVHQIAENHGGGATLQSREGHGTSVTLWLPLPEPRSR